MNLQRRNFLVRMASAVPLGALASVPAFPAAAEDVYPSKLIRLMVTTAAGGANDLVARTVGQSLSASMNQPVIIENQPAGNGNLAAGEVGRAAPDGYTLMMVVDSTLTINPHLYKNITYDVFRDFTPISIITRLPVVLLARPDLEVNDIRELIAYAKAHPGKLTYASTGVGTVLHVGMELFKDMTGTDIVHVPYRGTASAITDLMSGRIDLMLIGISSALGQGAHSKIKVLAIASTPRSPLLPQVPTIAESGVPGFEVGSWFGMLGPAGLPQSVVGRLTGELQKARSDPHFEKALVSAGMQIIISSPHEMRTQIAADSKKWDDLIKKIGLTIN